MTRNLGWGDCIGSSLPLALKGQTGASSDILERIVCMNANEVAKG